MDGGRRRKGKQRGGAEVSGGECRKEKVLGGEKGCLNEIKNTATQEESRCEKLYLLRY